MFSLRSNGLPCGADLAALPTPQHHAPPPMPPDATTRRSAGDRPQGDPADVRNAIIGVRVSASE